MTNHNRDRFRNARCIRRSRFQWLLLSTALHIPCCISLLWATEAVEPRNTSQSAPLETTPVLKSVGIRFVTPAAKKLDSVKSTAAFSEPAHIETVPSHAMPKIAINNDSPVKAKEINPSKVILNTVTSVPPVKMPPMVASSEPKLAVPVPNHATSVKMEMASITKSLGTYEKPSPAQIASTIKPIESNSGEHESAKTLALAPIPSLPTQEPHLEASPEATTNILAVPGEKSLTSSTREQSTQSSNDDEHAKTPMQESVVGNLSLAPPPSLSPLSAPPTLEPPTLEPSTLEPSTLELPKPQLPTLAKAPLQAGKKNAEDNSRAANVVRIPSMTLSSKNLESATSTPSVDASKEASPKTPSPAPKAAIANTTAKPEVALPVLNPLPATEDLVRKNDTGDHDLSNGPHSPETRVASKVSEQVAVIRQPVRESLPLEPTVVAIPASTKSSEWDRSAVSGLKPAPLPPSQADSETQSHWTSSTVELTYRDAQNIKLPGSIERVVVNDETICKAMVSDTNGIVLLGVGQGKTQIKVWLASDVHSEARQQHIDVTVREAWESRTPQGIASYTEATQSLAELFPTAKIAIRSSENGSLTIFGRADSDEQAKQIASLVRKMFLVPVQDRIATAPPK